MCGICGILAPRGSRVDPDRIDRMIRTIGHRGPDAFGTTVKDQLGFGHARLSIIDLAGGSQPMQTADGSLTITFNGEIFNYLELREELVAKGHRFATTSDTEVLLHLYQEEGDKCVHRLNGQWAFAIWDAPRQRLFLSRDRFGVRPLFYTHAGESFLFASEIKALLAYPGVSASLDLKALDEIFTFWVSVPPRTAFQNIHQLPPGHSMTIENGSVQVSQYWQLEFSIAGEDTALRTASEEDLSEQLLDLLLDATKIRLRADVPVGAYLSGGLDSTIITALASRVAGERLKTFSVGFEDAEFDESAYQAAASAFIGTNHRGILCSHSDIADTFQDVIWHCEQPILRTAPAPLMLLSKLVKANNIKVVLTGEGADEMLGGYDIFKEAKVRRFIARHPDSAWRPLLLKRLYPYLGDIQKQSPAYLKSFFKGSLEDLKNPYFSHLPRWDVTAKTKSFFSKQVQAELNGYTATSSLDKTLHPDFASWKPFHQAEYLEATSLLPGYILSSQGDRVAMANAVEARYPFLDHRVVSFAAALPSHLKMKVLNEKHLLRKAARGLVPDSILNRRKQPYRAPDGKSFFGAGDGDLAETLSESQIKRDGIFDPQAVTGLVNKFRANRASSVRDNMALLGILSTQILIDRFVNR
jgi:asparagine synthase (glutamine-hydrolysing)